MQMRGIGGGDVLSGCGVCCAARVGAELDCCGRMTSAVPESAVTPAVGMASVPVERTSAPQRVVKIRRDYNAWVADETKEDYALRFAARRHRRWSAWRVANTAFGASSFLVLEAVGATLLMDL